jgi:tetratricopeptide (TPR) repeat protein
MQDQAGSPEPFQRALARDPLTLSRHAALGDFYAKDGHVAETLEVIERIRELFVSDRSTRKVEAYRVIEALLAQIGKVDEAIAWTIRARDLEPDNIDHVYRLAGLYAEIGDFDTALELEPDSGLNILFRMRRYQELIDEAEFLMIDQPDDIFVRYLLAFGHTAVGNFENALRIIATTGQPNVVLDDTVRTAIDVDGFYTLANASYAIGERETARQLVQTDFDRSDENVVNASSWWYFIHISCALAILNREDEAIDVLGKLIHSPPIPWESYLRDSVCMKLLADRSEYQQILVQVETHKRELRERVPVISGALPVRTRATPSTLTGSRTTRAMPSTSVVSAAMLLASTWGSSGRS